MAIHEHDRENLLRDGRMMVFRGECDIDGVKVLVGFRVQGQLSLYLGTDPVFQFNSEGQLRRVFFNGRRFAAEHKGLVELTRDSRGGKVQLIRRPIEAGSLSALQSQLAEWIEKLSKSVDDPTSQWRVAGEEPGPYRIRVASWIEEHGRELAIADSPNA